MGEATDQIERNIQTTRENLSDNLDELQDRIKRSVNWRVQVSERPGTMLALAFSGGVILSAILPKVTRRRVAANGARSSSAPSQASGIFDALRGALVGVAVSKASSFIEELLPGFKEEFSKAKAAPALLAGIT